MIVQSLLCLLADRPERLRYRTNLLMNGLRPVEVIPTSLKHCGGRLTEDRTAAAGYRVNRGGNAAIR